MYNNWPTVLVITPTIPGREAQLYHCQRGVKEALEPYRGVVSHSVEPDDPPAGDWGVGARLRALSKRWGELIAYCDDDVIWRSSHLVALVSVLVSNKVDFVYSGVAQHGSRGEYAEVGEAPPRLGGIDTSCIIHRHGLLDTATWRPAGYASDWDLINRWLEAGCTWAFVPMITVDYY